MSYADGIEALHDEIPLFPVEFPQALIVVKTELQTGYGRFLKGTGSADCQIDVQLFNGIGYCGRGKDIA